MHQHKRSWCKLSGMNWEGKIYASPIMLLSKDLSKNIIEIALLPKKVADAF
jgi:hypothetical protein